MKKIFALLAFAVLATVAHAQQTGGIVGTVRDASGAVVPDASVRIINTETQFQRVVKTNAFGNVNLNNPRATLPNIQTPGLAQITGAGPARVLQFGAKILF